MAEIWQEFPQHRQWWQTINIGRLVDLKKAFDNLDSKLKSSCLVFLATKLILSCCYLFPHLSANILHLMSSDADLDW